MPSSAPSTSGAPSTPPPEQPSTYPPHGASISNSNPGEISPASFYQPLPPKTPSRSNHNQPASTSLSNKVSGTQTYSNGVDGRDALNVGLAIEMKGHFVGGMAVEVFFDKFLPCNDPCPDSKNAFKSMSKAKNELGMYKPFVDAINRFSPGIQFFDTHSKPDVERDGLSPDVSGYTLNGGVDEQNPQTDFLTMSTFVELKPDHAADPFCDPPWPDVNHGKAKNFVFERDTEEHMKRRGQIGSYAAALFGSQFRIHLFSVSICGETARFIRWDRTGAIVSRSFNYQDNPELLASFFWRYSHLHPHEQGYDPTVTAATKEEIKVAEEAFKKQNFRYTGYRKMMVPDRADPSKDLEKPFIIPFPPAYNCRSPFARATRPMFAYELESKKVVFLKEYWRPDVESMEKEGDIYKSLHEHNVPNIAPFGTGNDVRTHVTRTQLFLGERWACHDGGKERKMICLRQYRMTLLVIGLHLTEFSSSKELVSAIADAMKAHDHAYFDAKILHRDISVGNIIIDKDGEGVPRGLLIDWDMCVRVDSIKPGGRRPKRTGTWQFISAWLLQKPGQYHDLEDDRESALYVLLWVALRYTQHVGSDDDVVALLEAFDEKYNDITGNAKGGMGKRAFLTGPTGPEFEGRPHLNALIEDLCTVFAVRYQPKPTPSQLEIIDELMKHGPKSTPSQLEFLAELMKRGSSQNLVDSVAGYWYRVRMEKLKARNWLVKAFELHLNRDPWPVNDAAVCQATVVKLTTSRKRDADQAKLEDRVLRSKPRTGEIAVSQ